MEDYKSKRAKLLVRKKLLYCMSVEKTGDVLSKKSGIQEQMERLKQLKEQKENANK